MAKTKRAGQGGGGRAGGGAAAPPEDSGALSRMAEPEPHDAPDEAAEAAEAAREASRGRFAALGRGLKILRRRRGQKVTVVAKAVGVHPSVMSRWESGAALPSMSSFARLADHFGLHLGDLDDLLADARGWSHRPRTLDKPRTAAEVELLVEAILGPPPAEGPEPEPRATQRGYLRFTLLDAFGLNRRPGR